MSGIGPNRSRRAPLLGFDPSDTPTLKELGLSKMEASRSQRIAGEHPQETLQAHFAAVEMEEGTAMKCAWRPALAGGSARTLDSGSTITGAWSSPETAEKK